MDRDSFIAYYAFVNHGILPHEITSCSYEERSFIYQMILREIESRPKMQGGE